MTNSEITLLAREKLSGKWIPAILAFFIITLVSSSIVYWIQNLYVYPIDLPSDFPFFIDKAIKPNLSLHSGNIVALILGGAFSFGGAAFGIYLIRGFKADIELVFAGFFGIRKKLNRRLRR